MPVLDETAIRIDIVKLDCIKYDGELEIIFNVRDL